MVTAFSRGHPIYFDGQHWRFCDTNEIDDNKRPCARCGRPPTPEGYDACLGHIKGVISACCGHGVAEGYKMYEHDFIADQHLAWARSYEPEKCDTTLSPESRLEAAEQDKTE